MCPDFDDDLPPPSPVRAPWEKAAPAAAPVAPSSVPASAEPVSPAPIPDPSIAPAVPAADGSYGEPAMTPAVAAPPDSTAPISPTPTSVDAAAPFTTSQAPFSSFGDSGDAYDNGKLIAEQLNTLGYHPVVIVGTAGAGKTALLLSLLGYLRGASKATNVQVMLGQPLIDQTTAYGQQIQEQAVGLFNQALQAFLSGVAPPATKASQPFFVPVELQFHDGKVQRYAFLESDGEWYRPDYNSPALYKDLRPELEALFNHFKGSISMFYVAPATQMSFDGASPRRPVGGSNAASMRDAAQGLVGAMQHYSQHRAHKRRLDLQMFLLTKWDSVFEPGAASRGFEEPQLEDAVAFARDHYSDAFAYFESMNVGDRPERKKVVMQYSSGLMSNRIIASPDRIELRALHTYHRRLWNLLSRFAFGVQVDPEPISPRSLFSGLRNATDSMLGLLGVKPGK
ncbi:hypothetical protein [Aquilutibacter rugosus]|uniref:hypothetical protein n=1 Tax=Aquilutibacter rugosus TaxID=3115820 RepID=UPI002F40771D